MKQVHRNTGMEASERPFDVRKARTQPDQTSSGKSNLAVGPSGQGSTLPSNMKPQIDQCASLIGHWVDSSSEPTANVDTKPQVAANAPQNLSALPSEPSTEHAAARDGIAGPGRPLPFLDTIQRSFGRHDLSAVEAHVDARAMAGARALGTSAFAAGNHVAFADSPSLHMVAHEAAHVVQQRRGVELNSGVGHTGDEYEQHANQVADLVVKSESCENLLGEPSQTAHVAHGGAVQRYEAGEHAKMGDTQEHLKKANAPLQYTVIKDDTLSSIAEKFKISVSELKDANPNKLKKWPASNGSKKLIEGFNTGGQIAIPQKLNEMARESVKDPSIKITVNGVVLEYGAVIAMGGDLFGSPEELAATPASELQAIAELINEEKKTGKPVSTERWQLATKGRFLALAAKNEVHFAPSNPDFVAVSGYSTGDHRKSWEDHHRRALAAAKAGDKDKALLVNAFGDHFLTDAFSAGHLFNKHDVMERFNNQLPTTGKGKDREFTGGSKKFFDGVATTAFVGNVASEFAAYETVDWKGGLFRPNINSADRFSALLQAIHLEEPELLESAVAKGVHDKLDSRPGGLPVENTLGDKWSLSGDNTLNPETLAVARRAVAQSQQNVIAAFRATGEPDYPTLFKTVWDFTPRPTKESRSEITATVANGTDVQNNELRTAIIQILKANYLTIINELVKRNKLKRA